MSDDPSWVPFRFWPDPVSEAVGTADPRSNLFQEFLRRAIEMQLDKPDWFFAAADVGGVLEELDVHVVDLGEQMNVPPAYLWAVSRGWHRLGVRGLALIAEILEVPISRFFLKPSGASRLECRRYRAYADVAPHVTILGGSREL